MLVIDTSTLPVDERREAWADAMSSSEVQQLTDFVASPETPHHRLDVWPLLPGVHLLMNTGTPIRIARRERDLRGGSPERVALSLVGFPARIELISGQRRVQSGDMMLVDQTSPNDFTGSTAGPTAALIMDYATAGVTVDGVRTAMRSLTTNPLYEPLRSHLGQLTNIVRMSDDARVHRAMVEGTLQLFHAMVEIAVDDDSAPRADAPGALVPGVKVFIREHLTQHGLNPALIAAAHHVSVRTLYYAWSRTEIPLADWIMQQRLDAARVALGGRTSITTIAVKYGFSSSAHFARRFRDAYGVSPSEWRLRLDSA